MKPFSSVEVLSLFRPWLMLALLIVPLRVHADSWQATVAAQSDDLGTQVLAFLPNEMWIHAGDSITWTFAAAAPHHRHLSQIRTDAPLRRGGMSWHDSQRIYL